MQTSLYSALLQHLPPEHAKKRWWFQNQEVLLHEIGLSRPYLLNRNSVAGTTSDKVESPTLNASLWALAGSFLVFLLRAIAPLIRSSKLGQAALKKLPAASTSRLLLIIRENIAPNKLNYQKALADELSTRESPRA
jgi:hypothetical protein